MTYFRFHYLFLFRSSRALLRAGVGLQWWSWKAAGVMAMFEQMRANVGKLLKGIDRSELGRRERCSLAGWRFSETARGGQGLGLPWVGFHRLSARGEVILEEMLKETALGRPGDKIACRSRISLITLKFCPLSLGRLSFRPPQFPLSAPQSLSA